MCLLTWHRIFYIIFYWRWTAETPYRYCITTGLTGNLTKYLYTFYTFHKYVLYLANKLRLRLTFWRRRHSFVMVFRDNCLNRHAMSSLSEHDVSQSVVIQPLRVTCTTKLTFVNAINSPFILTNAGARRHECTWTIVKHVSERYTHL